MRIDGGARQEHGGPIKDFSILRPQLKVIFSGFMPGCSLFKPQALFHYLFLDAGTLGGKSGEVVRAFCYK